MNASQSPSSAASLLAQLAPELAQKTNLSESQMTAILASATLPKDALQGDPLTIKDVANELINKLSDIAKGAISPKGATKLTDNAWLLLKVTQSLIAQLPAQSTQQAQSLATAVSQNKVALLLQTSLQTLSVSLPLQQQSQLLEVLAMTQPVNTQLLTLKARVTQVSPQQITLATTDNRRPLTLAIPVTKQHGLNRDDNIELHLKKLTNNQWNIAVFIDTPKTIKSTTKLTPSPSISGGTAKASTGASQQFSSSNTATGTVNSNETKTPRHTIVKAALTIQVPPQSPLLHQAMVKQAEQGSITLPANQLSEAKLALLPKNVSGTLQQNFDLTRNVSLQLKASSVELSQLKIEPKALLQEAASTKITTDKGFSQTLPATSRPIMTSLGLSAQGLKDLPIVTVQQHNRPLQTPNKIDSPKIPVTSALESPSSTQAQIDTKEPIGSKVQEAVAKMPLEVKHQLQLYLQQNITKLLPQSAGQTAPLARIQQVLPMLTPVTKADEAVVTAITKQLQSLQPELALPESTQHHPVELKSNKATSPQLPPLVQEIKQLLMAPAMISTPAQVISPPTTPGFLSGLVTLLQITLAARATKQTNINQQIIADNQETLTTKTSPTKVTSNLSSRFLNDLNSLDNQHNLLRQIKALLANHQQAKVTNAEQALQGQDSFYYALPSIDANRQPAEILIKRQLNKDKEKKAISDNHAQWQLTMKLDVGNLGQLLAKTKFANNSIDLDLYTSSPALLEKVANTLPFLLKRLHHLGLDIGHSQFQMGKIPMTLADKPYQLLETRA
jgi:hypothetical protein